ncbi:YihY/virulence factor BrkB family protein [Corynebacterium comes]|uniref:Ribonuclease BN-like family protein n=1 Tax=Corynebacterium comes TaxID=2675218 RepID=A0A6B8VWZ6_9CORY|nr:YihY/virulence factor BrkB family protein [Corynebacterium comes]QGU03495.1 Ribonuclease BN-like family protein [Corynebacterium comes]
MSRPRLSHQGWRFVAGRTVREFWLGGGLDKAAMLTFFTLLTFAPTSLAIYSIATLVLANNAELVSELSTDFIGTYIPAGYRQAVGDVVGMVIDSSAGGLVGLMVGAAVALWSASAYVQAFSRCANIVYGQTEGRRFITRIGTMLATTLVLLLGTVGVLVSVMLNETVVNATLGPLAGPLGLSGVLDYLLGGFLPVWKWLKWPLIVGLVVVLIAVLYYTTPNVKQARFRWFGIGALVALLGLALVSVLFYLYLVFFASLSPYGAIGTLLALMFALWAANAMLILGVHVDAETERARQLREGVEAEREIQLRPRSTRRSDRKDEVREKMEERGRDLRMRYRED